MSRPTETPITVDTAPALLAALADGAAAIAVAGRIAGLPPVTLAPGQSLSGADASAALSFDGDGIALTAANRIAGLSIATPARCRAIGLADVPRADTRFDLTGIACRGRFQLVFGDETDAATVTIRDLTVIDADAGEQTERPHANGVDVLQGAVTIWNRATRPTVVRLDLDGVAIGEAERPVTGTGLFIAGAGDGAGGRVAMETLTVGAVHSDSGLPHGTTGTVAGGVFILQGATVGRILGTGPVVTHGPNAVPVDNWGDVGHWRIDGDAVSYGPSAIGFINAGTLGGLEVIGDIRTFGDGARGCGIYGPTGDVRAHAVRTRGDAAIGVQVIATLDALILSDGIFTEGAPGAGLVKGAMVETPAHAIHVEHGGVLGSYAVAELRASGRGALPVCNEGRIGPADPS